MSIRKKDLSTAFKETEKMPLLPEKDVFWADFKARASLVPQMDETPVGSPSSFWSFSWAKVMAAGVVLTLSGLISLKLIQPETAPDLVSEVQELDVFLDYSSMVILEDTDNGGTFVWITENDESNQG